MKKVKPVSGQNVELFLDRESKRGLNEIEGATGIFGISSGSKIIYLTE
jgi:hypothetical protein